MPELVHNLGLELPVYGPDAPVAWTTFDIMKAARSENSTEEPTFIRRMVLDYDGPRRLGAALKVATALIEATADRLGTDVVMPEWGLYEGLPPKDMLYSVYDSSRHRLIPDGYSLVATVRNVQPCWAPYSDEEFRVISGRLAEMRRSGQVPRVEGHLLGDMWPSQFMVTGYGELGPQFCLVDTEPRMSIEPW